MWTLVQLRANGSEIELYLPNSTAGSIDVLVKANHAELRYPARVIFQLTTEG
jgi:hypothetical protein